MCLFVCVTLSRKRKTYARAHRIFADLEIRVLNQLHSSSRYLLHRLSNYPHAHPRFARRDEGKVWRLKFHRIKIQSCSLTHIFSPTRLVSGRASVSDKARERCVGAVRAESRRRYWISREAGATMSSILSRRNSHNRRDDAKEKCDKNYRV